MNLIILTAFSLLLLPILGIAQSGQYDSVCINGNAAEADIVLSVCNHQHGMVGKPQPRLYLRIYADGRGEVETNAPEPPNKDPQLTNKTFRVDADEIAEIRRLGRMPDLQNAKDVYPAYAIGTDSSVTTTVVFNDEGVSKKIIVNNFSPVSADNKKHYGMSFCILMARVWELRDRGLGIVREPPTISFCELMHNREYYIGFVVAINAVLQYSETDRFIHDPECAEPGMGSLFTTEKVAVGFYSKTGKSKTLESQAMSLRDANFGGHARVYIYGILRENSDHKAGDENYRFDISEFKTIDRIILPYKGQLDRGWTYVDSFDAVGDELKLSSPLKMPARHAVRIEWINAERYPKLRAAGHTFISFRVLSRDIQKIGKYRWNDIYTCEILDRQ